MPDSAHDPFEDTSPVHPLGDPARLSALRHTQLMDSEHDPAFDMVVQLAARLIDAKVSLVSLVDDRRQFFKAAVGLIEPWATTRETPLSLSFCRHVVTSGDTLVISDSGTDPLVRDSPAIDVLGVGAYLGVPIHDDAQQVLGALCVIDPNSREWTSDEQRLLHDLAEMCEAHISLRIQQRRLRVAERTARVLAELGAQLAVADSMQQFAAAADEAGRQLVAASAGSVTQLLGRNLHFLQIHNVAPAVLLDLHPLAIDDDNPLSACARTATPMMFPSRAALIEAYPHTEQAVVRGAHEAYAAVPIVRDEEVLGVLGFMWDQPQVLDTETVDALISLGQVCGRALPRVRAEDDDRAVARIESHLSAASTVEEVRRIVAAEGAKLLDATTGAFHVIEEDPAEHATAGIARIADTAHPAQAVGAIDETRWTASTAELGSMDPGEVALREDRVVVIDGEREWWRDPSAQDTRDPVDVGGLVAAPVVSGPQQIGALVFTFAELAGPTERRRQLLDRLATMAGRAVTRASLLDTERSHAVRLDLLTRVMSATVRATTVDDVLDALTVPLARHLGAEQAHRFPAPMLVPAPGNPFADAVEVSNPSDGAAPTEGGCSTDAPTDGAAPTEGATPTEGGGSTDGAADALVADAVRRRRARWLESPAEVADAIRHAGGKDDGRWAARVVVPLVHDDIAHGAVAFAFSEPTAFLRADRSLVESAAALSAASLARVMAMQRLADSAASEAEARQLLHTLMTNAPLGWGFISADLVFRQVNDALAEMNGITAAEHIDRHVADVAPAMAPTVVDRMDRLRRTGQPVTGVEVRGDTPLRPGVERVRRESWYPIWGPNHRFLGAGVLMEEVTAEHDAERRRKAVHSLADQVSGAPTSLAAAAAAASGLLDVDAFDRVAVVWFPTDEAVAVRMVRAERGSPNVAVASLERAEPEALDRLTGMGAGDEFTDFAFHPTDRAGLVRVSWGRNRRGRGHHGELTSVVALIGQTLQRKLLNESLQRQHQRLEFLLEGTATGWWTWRVDTDAVEWSREVAQIFGVPAEEVTTFESVLRLLEPAAQLRLAEAVATAVEKGEGYELDLETTRGTWVWTKATLVSEIDGSRLLLGFLRDSTERQTAADRLRSSHQRLRDILDGLFVNVAILAVDGTVEEVNETAYRASGLTPELTVGLAFWELPMWSFDADNARTLRHEIELAAAGGTPRRFDILGEFPTGVLSLDLQVVPVIDGGGEVVSLVLSSIDITERLQNEHRLAELLQRQQDITRRLQADLLPRSLPEVPGYDLVARYDAAEDDLDVGGDWYDAFQLADGTVVLVIGDVVGRGLDAAGATGQLRTVTRGAAAVAGAGPAEVVHRVDTFASTIPAALGTTLAYLELDPATGAVRLCRAGHIPPVELTSTGRSIVHEAHGSLPLGIASQQSRPVAEFTLDPGSTLVLCTDGLLERRTQPVDVGLDRLRASLVTHHRHPSPAELLDNVVRELTDRTPSQDDLCVVLLRRH